MKTLRELFNSYATPVTQSEQALLDKLVSPLSTKPGRGEETSAKPTRGD